MKLHNNRGAQVLSYLKKMASGIAKAFAKMATKVMKYVGRKIMEVGAVKDLVNRLRQCFNPMNSAGLTGSSWITQVKS